MVKSSSGAGPLGYATCGWAGRNSSMLHVWCHSATRESQRVPATRPPADPPPPRKARNVYRAERSSLRANALAARPRPAMRDAQARGLSPRGGCGGA
eukprot:1772903-Prymnesium_polylepis.1